MYVVFQGMLLDVYRSDEVLACDWVSTAFQSLHASLQRVILLCTLHDFVGTFFVPFMYLLYTFYVASIYLLCTFYVAFMYLFDALYLSTEKNLVEHKDKIPEDVKTDVQKAIDDVKAVQESEDSEEIKAKVQALQVRFCLSPGSQHYMHFLDFSEAIMCIMADGYL